MDNDMKILAYVIITDDEFVRYVADAGGGGTWKIRAEKDCAPVVVIDGGRGEKIHTCKCEVAKGKLLPEEDISRTLSFYLDALAGVLKNAGVIKRDEASEIRGVIKVLTHWGGGMPQDVTELEEQVSKLVESENSLVLSDQCPNVKWECRSISSLRNDVFNISRGRIAIPSAEECEQIIRWLKLYGGGRDALTLVSSLLSVSELTSENDGKLLREIIPNDVVTGIESYVESIREEFGNSACGKSADELMAFLAAIKKYVTASEVCLDSWDELVKRHAEICKPEQRMGVASLISEILAGGI